MPLNTCTEICNLLKNYKITVTKEHIDLLDASYDEFCKSRTHADSLLLEIDLILKGYLEKPNHKGHDGQFGDKLQFKPDFKEIHKQYHNFYSEKTYEWIMENIVTGNTTHFVPYKIVNRDRGKEFDEKYVYQEGDDVVVQMIEFTEARKYIKRSTLSKRSGCYKYVIPMYNA